MKDLEKEYAGFHETIFQERIRLYETQSNYLEAFLQQELIKLEAEKRGIDKDELIETEITSKIGEVTDRDIESVARERDIPPKK